MPTFVDIAGGPKGDELKKQIEGREISRTRQDDPRRFNQSTYLEGTSDKSAREDFFYFSGSTPSAVRYKNWKIYYTMAQPGPAGWIMPLIPFHFTLSRTSSAIRSSSRLASTEVGDELGRCACRPDDRVSIRLEHAAHRSEVVAGASRRTSPTRHCKLRQSYNLSQSHRPDQESPIDEPRRRVAGFQRGELSARGRSTRGASRSTQLQRSTNPSDSSCICRLSSHA